MKIHIHRWSKEDVPQSRRRIRKFYSSESGFGEQGPCQYRTCKRCGLEEERWDNQHPLTKNEIWRLRGSIGPWEERSCRLIQHNILEGS